MASSNGVLNIRALVVEDDPVWQKIHTNTLSDNHCEHLATDDIDIAVKHIKENYVQLAIIDLDLSRAKKYGQNRPSDREQGWQLVQMISQNLWLKNMVVCVVSHWSDISGLEEFNKRGIFGITRMRPNLASGVEVNGVIYFSKNEYTPKDFWERIERNCRKKNSSRNCTPMNESLLKCLQHA